jgi:predicted phosphodiesterase
MKIIAAGDFHFPFCNEKALVVFEKHLGREKWDHLVLGGDILDFSYLSKYSIGNLRSVEGKRIMKDYEEVNKHLDRWDKLAGKAKKHFIIGNHDLRVEKYINANPNLEGLIELETCLRLKERGYNIVRNYPAGEVLKLDNILFIHGTYHNQFHAKKHLDSYDSSIIYFHTHTFQSFCKVRFDKKGYKIAQAVGALCDLEQEYMGKRPSAWINGFVEIKDGDIHPIML